ncbi:MAG TPA: carboxypeptidase-like regulatory domain-containing protein, partial [Terriglobales bacterium]
MGKFSTALRSVTCLLFAIATPPQIYAQQITGTIRGTILDPNGAVVTAATVSATQDETGLVRTTTPDRQGNYVLLELPIGHYQLQVQSQNFEKYLQQGIALNVNQVATVHVRLRVGSDMQQVEVRADAALVQDTVSSLGETVMQRQILDLPLDGRNFSQLGTLQPGVVPLTPGLLEAGGPARQNQAYAVDGQRPESNNFMIDGADNESAVDGGFVLKPPIDAIAEFKILSHNANAEFGRNT